MNVATDAAIHLVREPRIKPYAPPEMSRPRPMTVEDFMVLVDAGLVEGRVELVHGVMIEMAAQGNGHSVSIQRNHDGLRPSWAFPKFIRTQATHRFTEDLAYEPDLALLESEPISGALIDELPQLIIQISDTTFARDMGIKRLDYARCGVPEYWVGDLHRRRILKFRGPDLNAADAVSAWAEERIFEANEVVEPLCIPGLRLKVSGLLPAAGF